jgi:DNA-binding transcriptional LysR family regulator
MLDVRRLLVLQAVVETGSVTAAAQRLQYTPSAVSQQLATLEREAGTALVERVGRGLRPTPAGLLLHEHAKPVFDRLADAEHAFQAFRAGQLGSLSLVAFPTAGSGLVPAAVGRFRAHCPQVQLTLGVAEQEAATRAVRDGTADVAVTIEDGEPQAPGLRYLHLLDDPYRIALPRGHRLAARGRVDLADLADDSWIAIASCPDVCQAQAHDACVRAGFSPRFDVEADDYPAAQGYVAVGLGVCLIPQLALGAMHEGIVVRRIKGGEPCRRVFAVTRPAGSDGPAAVMLDALRAAAGDQRETFAA